MSLMAHADYMRTGSPAVAEELWETLLRNTMIGCVSNETQLVDFRRCVRPDATHDIIDWPATSRDGYVMSNVSTVINSYFVGAVRALAALASAMGRAEEQRRLALQANKTAAAMRRLLVSPRTGLFVDALGSNHTSWHASAFALWHGVADFGRGIARVRDWLRRRRMVGSVYAAYGYLLVLYDADDDHGAAALDVLTNCDVHSWCHMLHQVSSMPHTLSAPWLIAPSRRSSGDREDLGSRLVRAGAYDLASVGTM